jgi:hypothetical protein
MEGVSRANASSVAFLPPWQNTDEETAKMYDILIPAALRGCLHRRSTFKKDSQWQFIPTNLNIQMLYIAAKTPGEVGELFPTVTFGCPAAHGCGFNHGGLRHVFQALDPTGLDHFRMARDLNSLQTLTQLKDDFLAAERLIQSMGGAAPEGENAKGQGEGPAVVPAAGGEEREKAEREKRDIKELHALRLLKAVERADVSFSQCLATGLTSLNAFLNLCLISPRHRQILPRIMVAGFLTGFESLLSTSGHEIGMIQDMAVACKWLSSTTVRLLAPREGQGQPEGHGVGSGEKSPDIIDTSPRAPETRDPTTVPVGRCENIAIWRRGQASNGLIVDWTLTEPQAGLIRHLRTQLHIPREVIRAGQGYDPSEGECLGTFQLVGVVFTQGINERQTLSNLMGDQQLQQDLNEENLKVRCCTVAPLPV